MMKLRRSTPFLPFFVCSNYSTVSREIHEFAKSGMEKSQVKSVFGTQEEKHGVVHVKVQKSAIFDFVLSAGLKNIFEFRKVGKEKLLAALSQDKKKQSDDLHFFSNMEKFRNNVDLAQDLLAELNVPVCTLSKTNQVSTMLSIRQHMGYAQARIIFLTECTSDSFKTLAELRRIHAIMRNKSSSTIGKNDFEKNARRLLSIKHEVSLWVYVVHVLSLINLSTLSLTHIEKQSLPENDIKKKGKKTEKEIVWYECKLLFLKRNQIIAMKYFQSAESLDKKKMLFGKPNYLVGDKHLISPITFYVDALTTDKSKPAKNIPKVFENLFFTHEDYLSGQPQPHLPNSKSFQDKNSRQNYKDVSVTRTNGSYAIEPGFSSASTNEKANFSVYDGDYDLVMGEDLNNTNFQDVSVVALTDDEAAQ